MLAYSLSEKKKKLEKLLSNTKNVTLKLNDWKS